MDELEDLGVAHYWADLLIGPCSIPGCPTSAPQNQCAYLHITPNSSAYEDT